MFGRRKGGEQEVDTELNLVPIMNLFTALIPFLLLSAAFIQVKVINASTPAISEGSEVPEGADLRPVVMNVQITKQGYEVTASGDQLSKQELAALGTTIGKHERSYEPAKLTSHLRRVKHQHPKSDTVIIAPDPRVEYAEIVRVMDASREVPGSKEAGKKKYLFPKVVVTALHQ